MRRILTAAMLAGALLGVAACADDSTVAAPSSSAAASAAPAGADRKTVCDSYKAAERAATRAMAEAMGQVMSAAGDAAKVQAVLTELVGELTKFQSTLTADAARSTDPELKAAIESDVSGLSKLITGFTSTGGDQAKMDAFLDSPEFKSLGEKTKALCAA